MSLKPSPYDLDARNGKKRSTFWTGYKVHFTQTCDEDAPQLITHVQTTPAPHSDEGVLMLGFIPSFKSSRSSCD